MTAETGRDGIIDQQPGPAMSASFGQLQGVEPHVGYAP